MRQYLLFTFLMICHLTIHGQPTLSELTRSNHPKIGLVLGGGGAKGAAEIGALKALEECGIEVDCIAGTSIGAIIGALYSCGYRSQALEELFLSQSWLSLMTDRDTTSVRGISRVDGTVNAFGYKIATRPDVKVKRKKEWRKKIKEQGYGIAGIGMSNGDRLVCLFDSLTGHHEDLSFDDLPIPFRCVASDMRKNEAVVIDHGVLSIAMRASMAIPGMFKPVKIDSLYLVDGGMHNNLPVDVARSMGADIIIAIDLTQNKHKPKNFSLKETFGIGGMLDWIFSRPDWTTYDKNVSSADIYVNPDLEGYDILDFKQYKIVEMIRIGYEATKSKLMEINR